MPEIGRIDWVLHQVSMGRRVHMSVGSAQDSNKTKFKITLEPPSSGEISIAAASCLTPMLLHLRDLAMAYPAVERGHHHSSGVAVVSIWIGHVASVPAAQVLPREGAEPDSEVVTASPNGQRMGRSSEGLSAEKAGGPSGPVLAAGPHPAMTSGSNGVTNVSNRTKLTGTWERLLDRAWEAIIHGSKHTV